MPTPFRIYNTLSRSVDDYVPQQPGKVGLYVCGMTVYGPTHVGHARAMVVFDAFVRYLRFGNWDVRFVRNFTDVDDKIIARAAEDGVAPDVLAQANIDRFHEDMHALGLLQPDAEPRVSTSIDDILGLIGRLMDNDSAYASEGSVWFAVESFAAYGRLSGQRLDGLQSPDAVPGKRHPADFALWKAAKPGEPAWESPWGPGRPGWHIECSAMCQGALGETVDIHGGGIDLVFPHHENEIAQSEADTHQPFVRHWMHNGMLTMSSGQKMGKSLGNVINVVDALETFPAEVLRLYYLQALYRSPLPWDADALPAALGMLCRLYEAREVAEAMGGTEPVQQVADALGDDAKAVLEHAAGFSARYLGALADDFNTAKALSYVFELVRAINRLGNHKKARKRGGPVVAEALAALRLVTESLGLLGMPTDAFIEEVKDKRLGAMGVSRADVAALLDQRTAARAAKDWARADVIRGELEQMNIAVMDRADGVDWRVRVG
jgi:cysteinyl-tRNA synthetase